LDVQTLLQIEHVMPVSWGEHWLLEGAVIPRDVARTHWLAKDELLPFQEQIRHRNAAIQTLGNLTLLNKYLNPAASNGDFPMKLVEYKNSVLRLNRYFDHLSAWDEASITRRGSELGEAICKIWARPLVEVPVV